jgi:hypothetical protein
MAAATTGAYYSFWTVDKVRQPPSSVPALRGHPVPLKPMEFNQRSAPSLNYNTRGQQLSSTSDMARRCALFSRLPLVRIGFLAFTRSSLALLFLVSLKYPNCVPLADPLLDAC